MTLCDDIQTGMKILAVAGATAGISTATNNKNDIKTAMVEMYPYMKFATQEVVDQTNMILNFLDSVRNPIHTSLRTLGKFDPTTGTIKTVTDMSDKPGTYQENRVTPKYDVKKAQELLNSDKNPVKDKTYTPISSTTLAGRSDGKYTCMQFVLDEIDFLKKNGIKPNLVVFGGHDKDGKIEGHAAIAIETGMRNIKDDAGHITTIPAFTVLEAQRSKGNKFGVEIGTLGKNTKDLVLLEDDYIWKDAIVFQTKITELPTLGTGTNIIATIDDLDTSNIYSYTQMPYEGHPKMNNNTWEGTKVFAGATILEEGMTYNNSGRGVV